MSTLIDLTGMRFGRLVVVERGPNVTKGKPSWVLRCDCGNTHIASSSNLKKGNVMSCGCLQRELSSKRLKGMTKKLEEGEAALNELYGRYRRTAEIRGLDFNLNKADFKDLVLADCHYCGAAPNLQVFSDKKLQQRFHNGNLIYNGIDRKENTAGYVRGNMVTCCKTCNYAKHDKSYGEFLNYLDRLVKFRRFF